MGDFSLKAHTFLLEDQPNRSKQDKDGFSGTKFIIPTLLHDLFLVSRSVDLGQNYIHFGLILCAFLPVFRDISAVVLILTSRFDLT